MKLSDIFEIHQGHQITDEEIYKSIGNIPIYTGNNDIKGYWSKSIVTEDMLPCITYPTKAFSGSINIQTQLFDANNTAVLYLKKDLKETVYIEYIKYVLKNKFLKMMTSKENISYLNREIVENIDLYIPDEKVQKQIIDRYKIFDLLLCKINSFDQELNQIEKNKTLLFEHKNYQAKDVPVNEVLDYLSGNTGLTEESIYQFIQVQGPKYKVLSSSTEDNTQMGEVCQIDINGKLIKVFSGKEGLLVTRNGKAGQTKFLPKGNYTINDHAYILFKKKSCKYEINLQWLAFVHRNEFLSYSSNSDNGTWNMSGFFKNVRINIPSIEEQTLIANKFDKLKSLKSKLELMKNDLSDFMNKEIVL